MKVSEILKLKGNILYTAPPDMPLLEAINIMSDRDVGSLVVMKEGKMQGMLSFREVINAIDKRGGDCAPSLRAVADALAARLDEIG